MSGIEAKRSIEKILVNVGVINGKDMTPKIDRRKGRVFRKKRGRIPKNQRKDLIKDIRGLLRVMWKDEDQTEDIELLRKVKSLLTS